MIIVEFAIFSLLLTIGIFREYAIFQIPAAASLLLLFTIFVMIAGAFSYWFGRWSTTVAIGIFILLNIITQNVLLPEEYKVYGLNYNTEKVVYNLETNSKRFYTETILGALNPYESKESISDSTNDNH